MKKVTIIGCGALGSNAALFLRNCANMTVIDYDRVERKNVLSQFHAQGSVGKLKVMAVQQIMQFLFGTKVSIIPHKLTVLNVREILSGTDLILDCLDNGESRRIVQKYARDSGTPCLHGALAGAGGFGRVIWDEDFAIDNETGVGAATCEDGFFLPFIAVVATHLAYSAQQFLETGKKIGFQISPAGTIAV